MNSPTFSVFKLLAEEQKAKPTMFTTKRLTCQFLGRKDNQLHPVKDKNQKNELLPVGPYTLLTSY